MALRFYDLGGESYWLDEFDTLRVAPMDVGEILARTAVDRPPVLMLLEHFWVGVFGTNEAATRSLTALLGVAALVLMYMVGRRLFGHMVATLATLLMTLSEFQVSSAQEIRFYSLFLLTSLLSIYFYLRALESPSLQHFALYVVASVLMFYSQYYGLFVLGVQNLYFVLKYLPNRKLVLQWAAAQAAILAGIGLMLWRILRRGPTAAVAINDWIRDPPWTIPLETLYHFVLPSTLDWWAPIVAGAILCTGALYAWRRKRAQHEAPGQPSRWLVLPKEAGTGVRDKLLLLGCWLVVPLALMLVLSKLVGPMYVHRYAIPSSAALYLLLALVLVSIRRVVPLAASLAAIVVLLGPGLVQYYRQPVNEQWRELVAYVEGQAQSGQTVVFVPGEMGALRQAFNWYSTRELPQCDINVTLRQESEISQVLRECLPAGGPFWMVIRWDVDNYPERVAHLRRFFLDESRFPRLQQREFKWLTLLLVDQASTSR